MTQPSGRRAIRFALSTCPPRPTLPRFVIGRFAEDDEEKCERTGAFARLGRTTIERLPFHISNLRIEVAGQILELESPGRDRRRIISTREARPGATVGRGP